MLPTMNDKSSLWRIDQTKAIPFKIGGSYNDFAKILWQPPAAGSGQCSEKDLREVGKSEEDSSSGRRIHRTAVRGIKLNQMTALRVW
jgi:hypothetical protein